MFESQRRKTGTSAVLNNLPSNNKPVLEKQGENYVIKMLPFQLVDEEDVNSLSPNMLFHVNKQSTFLVLIKVLNGASTVSLSLPEWVLCCYYC